MSTTTQQGSEVRLLVHVPKHQNKKTVDCSLRNSESILFIGRVSKTCLVFVTIFQFTYVPKQRHENVKTQK